MSRVSTRKWKCILDAGVSIYRRSLISESNYCGKLTSDYWDQDNETIIDLNHDHDQPRTKRTVSLDRTRSQLTKIYNVRRHRQSSEVGLKTETLRWSLGSFLVYAPFLRKSCFKSDGWWEDFKISSLGYLKQFGELKQSSRRQIVCFSHWSLHQSRHIWYDGENYWAQADNAK